MTLLCGWQKPWIWKQCVFQQNVLIFVEFCGYFCGSDQLCFSQTLCLDFKYNHHASLCWWKHKRESTLLCRSKQQCSNKHQSWHLRCQTQRCPSLEKKSKLQRIPTNWLSCNKVLTWVSWPSVASHFLWAMAHHHPHHQHEHQTSEAARRRRHGPDPLPNEVRYSHSLDAN